MEVSFEKTGPCEAKVSVSVPSSEFESEVQRGLRSAGRNVRMKGFRPGKVPAAVLEKQFGDEVRNKTVEVFLGRAYEQVVEQHELQPVGHQRVNVEELELAPGKDFEHTFEISLRPEIEFQQYKGLPVESQLEPVLDQEIEGAIEDLKRQRARPEKAGEEGLTEDGMAVCKLAWTKDGETLLEREGLRLAPITPPPGVDPEAFQEAMTGAREGAELAFDMTIPDDYEKEELRGQPARCELTLSEVFKMVLPSDEEIYEAIEVADGDALRALARERIGEAKRLQEHARIESELVDRILASHEIELPQRMLDSQYEARVNSLRTQLGSQGLEEAAIEEEISKQEEETRAAVEKGLKAFFLVQGIAEKEDIQLSRQDLVDELKAIAERNQASFEEVREYYGKQGLMDQVAIELLERRVRKFLRENAEIKEPS